MIKVNIYGGLGNQMFQYAFGRALALRHQTELALDLSWYGYRGKNIQRQFALNDFKIQAELTGQGLSGLVIKIFIKFGLVKVVKEKQLFEFDQSLFLIKRGRLDGYWQNQDYFKDFAEQIRQDFNLNNEFGAEALVYKGKIKQTESVAIHIRRGDYVANQETNKFHGACTIEYYQRAIEIIKQKVAAPHFFVFSDDIDWVKTNLPINEPVDWVSGQNLSDTEELTLMSLCQHQIIANSSFSWWAAWLNRNDNKLVIGPKNWINNNVYDTSNLLPADWLKL